MPPVFKRNLKFHPNTVEAKANSTQTTPYFNAKQMASIYGFPPVNTAIKNVVGVLSFGGGLYGVPPNISTPYIIPPYTSSSQCDVQKYWAYLGYTTAQMPKVIVYPLGNSVNNLTDSDSTGENTMDVSVIGGCCPNPNLTIILFICPQTYSFSQALLKVLAGVTVNQIQYTPTILSISWGTPEIYYLTNGVDTFGELTKVSSILQAATQKGINICVAAGDNGCTDGNGTTQLSVDFPSSCPYVTAVGGTTLICPSKTTYDSSTKETVWNDGFLNGAFSATGGGVSAYYTKPDYQQTVQLSNDNNYRHVPDIAFNSDPDTGLILYLNGQLQGGWGGTSMAAPMFAAYLAIINQTSFVNPLLYSAAKSSNSNNFHDITSGNNDSRSASQKKLYTAGAGYDCCSGLGTINGINLTRFLVPVSAPVPVPAPPKIILGSSIRLNKTSLALNTINNKTVQLVATILPTNTTNKTVRWILSNPSIATVSTNGLVTAKNRGNVMVAAMTTDGSNRYIICYITISSTIAMSFK